MNTVKTIQQKIDGLPLEAQQEVLEAVEQIERRYTKREKAVETEHPLTAIGRINIDVGVTDFAERHDFYARGKLED